MPLTDTVVDDTQKFVSRVVMVTGLKRQLAAGVPREGLNPINGLGRGLSKIHLKALEKYSKLGAITDNSSIAERGL